MISYRVKEDQLRRSNKISNPRWKRTMRKDLLKEELELKREPSTAKTRK